jgi:transcriptional regulator with XRE-family HTH domain
MAMSGQKQPVLYASTHMPTKLDDADELEKTKLREVREREGLSRTELAGLAGAGERTIQRAEKGESISARMRSRILNGFNRHQRRLQEYKMDDLFD